MRSMLKRNILVALICALPAVLGVESATGHSGAGSSSGMGSSSGAGSSSGTGSSSGHGGAIPGSAPSSGHSSTGSGHSSTGLSSGHSSTGLNSGHSSTGLNSGHSSTGLNSAHMSGASLGGHFATNPVTHVTMTGDAASGRFIHTGASRTNPVQSAKQRQFTSGYVPSNLQENDELWRKRHPYHRFYSP